MFNAIGCDVAGSNRRRCDRIDSDLRTRSGATAAVRTCAQPGRDRNRIVLWKLGSSLGRVGVRAWQDFSQEANHHHLAADAADLGWSASRADERTRQRGIPSLATGSAKMAKPRSHRV